MRIDMDYNTILTDLRLMGMKEEMIRDFKKRGLDMQQLQWVKEEMSLYNWKVNEILENDGA